MKEMKHCKFTAAADLDRNGKKLYEFRHWDQLYSYKSQLSPRVRKWYDSMEESGGRNDDGITVYSYKNIDVNLSHWVADYMKNGGILLDDSEVEKA